MHRLPQPIFDIYALSLPRGHAFGDRPPVEAWQSEDGLAWGAVTRDVTDRGFGVLVMRRREDHVWVMVHQEARVLGLSGCQDGYRILNQGGRAARADSAEHAATSGIVLRAGS